MGCNDNGLNGGCRLNPQQIDQLAQQITDALSNTPLNRTVSIEGFVPLTNGRNRPAVGNSHTSGQDLFTGEPPTLSKDKLKDFLCDISRKAEKDRKFKDRYNGGPTYNISIRIIVGNNSVNIPVPYPGPLRGNIHQP